MPRYRHPRLQADLFKSAVPLVVEQKAPHRIVGDEDVREAVAIHIGKRHAHPLAHQRADS